MMLVDTSTPVASHIIRLQQDLKLLIQQQLPLVDSFNMARSVCVSPTAGHYSLTITVVLTVAVNCGRVNWLSHHVTL